MTMTRLTDRQISNAGQRASRMAYEAVNQSQIEMFGATEEQMSSERGNVANAAQCAAMALGRLESGDYEGFLSMLRLAGQFAEPASDVYYRRKLGLTRRADRPDLYGANCPLGQRTGY
jgi:hypothetical protein